MGVIQIGVKNLSTYVRDEEVQRAMAAMQIQATRDFEPCWGVAAKLQFYSAKQAVPGSSWMLGIYDDADAAGALGYHDLTRTGQPLGKVFAATTAVYGGEWTVTMSHELLELLVDPNINLCAFDESAGRLYAYEVCDAVEADALAYKVDGVWVSDFVLPGWFEPLRVTKGERFAFKSKVKKPFALLPGGYISFFDVGSGAGWQQLEARTEPAAAAMDRALAYYKRAQVGSRRERRRTPKTAWVRSSGH